MNTDFIPVAEAARLLDVSPRTLCKYCNEFKLINFRVLWARRWVVSRPDVDRLVRLGLTGRALALHTLQLRHLVSSVTTAAAEGTQEAK